MTAETSNESALLQSYWLLGDFVLLLAVVVLVLRNMKKGGGPLSRRDQITMTTGEIENFLQRRQTVSLASIDTKGKIHLVAMWYGFYEGQIAMWTYGKSQKIMNLRSNPNVTMLIEDGDRYEELRGVEIVGVGRIVEDRPTIEAIGSSIFDRYVSPDIDGDVAVLREGFVKSAQKRLGIVVEVEKIVSWDHRKLQGVY